MFIDEVGSNEQCAQNSLDVEKEGRLGSKTVQFMQESTQRASLFALIERCNLQTNAKIIRSMGFEGSVEGGVNIRWGGEDSVKVGGYFQGEISDDNGNYAKGQIKQNNDGSGEANISAGHKKEK